MLGPLERREHGRRCVEKLRELRLRRCEISSGRLNLGRDPTTPLVSLRFRSGQGGFRFRRRLLEPASEDRRRLRLHDVRFLDRRRRERLHLSLDLLAPSGCSGCGPGTHLLDLALSRLQQIISLLVRSRQDHLGLGGDAVVGILLHALDLRPAVLDDLRSETSTVLERLGHQGVGAPLGVGQHQLGLGHCRSPLGLSRGGAFPTNPLDFRLGLDGGFGDDAVRLILGGGGRPGNDGPPLFSRFVEPLLGLRRRLGQHGGAGLGQCRPLAFELGFERGHAVGE